MRVPANEVEQAIVLAQTEVERSKESVSLSALIVAFQRAAVLRDTPMFAAYVVGRRDKQQRLVIVTTQTKGEPGNGYALCLMPYNDTEITNARRTRPRYQKQRDGGFRALLPQFQHELWIRQDRLERVA